MTPSMFRLDPCKACIHYAISRFFPEKNWGQTTEGHNMALHNQNRERTLFSQVAVPRWRWRDWTNCGNAAKGKKKKKKRTHWWRRQGRWRAVDRKPKLNGSEQTGNHSMESAGVSESIHPVEMCFPWPPIQSFNFWFLWLFFCFGQ